MLIVSLKETIITNIVIKTNIVIITNVVIYIQKSNSDAFNSHIKCQDVEDFRLLCHGSLRKYISFFEMCLLSIIWHSYLSWGGLTSLKFFPHLISFFLINEAFWVLFA